MCRGETVSNTNMRIFEITTDDEDEAPMRYSGASVTVSEARDIYTAMPVRRHNSAATSSETSPDSYSGRFGLGSGRSHPYPRPKALSVHRSTGGDLASAGAGVWGPIAEADNESGPASCAQQQQQQQRQQPAQWPHAPHYMQHRPRPLFKCASTAALSEHPALLQHQQLYQQGVRYQDMPVRPKSLPEGTSPHGARGQQQYNGDNMSVDTTPRGSISGRRNSFDCAAAGASLTTPRGDWVGASTWEQYGRGEPSPRTPGDNNSSSGASFYSGTSNTVRGSPAARSTATAGVHLLHSVEDMLQGTHISSAPGSEQGSLAAPVSSTTNSTSSDDMSAHRVDALAGPVSSVSVASSGSSGSGNSHASRASADRAYIRGSAQNRMRAATTTTSNHTMDYHGYWRRHRHHNDAAATAFHARGRAGSDLASNGTVAVAHPSSSRALVSSRRSSSASKAASRRCSAAADLDSVHDITHRLERGLIDAAKVGFSVPSISQEQRSLFCRTFSGLV